jgi:ELWxxDGT repeat protein
MSDGTSIGTRRVDDNIPGNHFIHPKNLTAVGNTLFFTFFNDVSGHELWRSDGRSASLVADIRPGNRSSYPNSLTAFGDTLFFSANDNWAEGDPIQFHGSGNKLWRSDGTGASLVADINPGGNDVNGQDISSNPRNPTAAGSTLFFTTSFSTGANG